MQAEVGEDRVQNVDDGVYFQHARDWARLLYETPIIERSYALLAVLITLMCIVVNIMTFSSLLPLEKTVRVMFEANNNGKEFTRVRRIAKDRIPLPDAIARFSLKHYITLYETYRYDQEDISNAYRFIFNNSAADVFSHFRERLNPTNPKSDITTLGDKGQRSIDGLVIQLEPKNEENGLVTYHATARFDRITRQGSRVMRAPQRVDIELLMYKIEIHKADKSVYQYDAASKTMKPLNGRIGFRVVRYQPQT